MEYLIKFLPIYFCFINLFAVLLCITDKSRAKKHGWRISEKALFAVSLLGGSVGMYITMRLIRHKTLHKRFMIGIPVIIVLQIFAMFFMFYKFYY